MHGDSLSYSFRTLWIRNHKELRFHNSDTGYWKTMVKGFKNSVGKYLAHNSILSQNYQSSEDQNEDTFHIPLIICFLKKLMKDVSFQNRKPTQIQVTGDPRN